MDFMKIVFSNGLTFDVYPEGKWVFSDEHRNEVYIEVCPTIEEWWTWNSQRVENTNTESNTLQVKMIDPYDGSIVEEGEVHI